MKAPLRVVWSEGLSMSPHHLQQLDLYHEGLLGSRLDAVAPPGWGVLKVELDRAALASGQVRLETVRAVLPDGLVIDAGESHPELPPSRPVEGHFPHTRRTLEVYVAVPREREGLDNYAREPGGGRRFVIAPRPVEDRTGEGRPLEVEFAQRNVQLLFGDEPRNDVACLQVAELARDAAGSLIVNESYIPPILQLGASPGLLAGLRRLLRLMATRRRDLIERARDRGDATVAYDATDVTRFLLLNGIHTFLPVLGHLVDAPDLPPRTAYLWLVALAGQLATFSADFDPADLPPFAYGDLRSTFEPLLDRIADLLGATVKAHYASLPLDARQDGMHLGQLTDERLIGCGAYLLGIRSSATDPEIASALPRLSKVASWADIPRILAAATPGAPVEVTFRPPSEVPVRAGTVYFLVATDNPYWRNLINDRQIAVYLPRDRFDPARTRVELLGVPRTKQATWRGHGR
ncbi:MAG: type VI secretion system baseplate subunit TssK [Sandaracinaceae bacterium]